MLKLADTSLILINPSPSNVKDTVKRLMGHLILTGLLVMSKNPLHYKDDKKKYVKVRSYFQNLIVLFELNF